MALRGGCFGLGLTDIRESKSTNEAPAPRKDAGFLVSSAVFVAESPIDRKKSFRQNNFSCANETKENRSNAYPWYLCFYFIYYFSVGYLKNKLIFLLVANGASKLQA